MFVLPLTRNCRNILSHLAGLSEIQRHVLGQSYRFTLVRFCAINASSEKSKVVSKTKLDSVSMDSGDVFGTLQQPLERKTFRSKSRSEVAKKDVKVIKLKNRPKFNKTKDSDVFGNLSNKDPVWYPDINEDLQVDNDQSDDSVIVRNISKQYRDPRVYLDKMKLLVSEKKLKEALELFVDMKRNFVIPIHAHYTFMIGACGRFGYTDMAFKLLRQMTDRCLQPTCATLTGLFNSCAECPFPEFGLRKANLLKEKITSKNWKLNQVTYHSMIKAFGKCGDIQTAFQIVDEMAKADIKIDVETYCFLLMSCVANKEAGFTHAIEVCRKMKERKCQPSLFSFNLLLRAARDCDVGPEEISCLLLQHWSSFSKRPYGFKTKETLPKKEILQLMSSEAVQIDSDSVSSASDQIEEVHITEDSFSPKNEAGSALPQKRPETFIDKIRNGIPSILHSRPISCAEVVDLGVIKTPSDRLALIGGAENFLIDMKRNKVKPNIKTFTLLLECLPSTTEAEEQLLSLLDIYGVKPDIGFFNMLIKKRNWRQDLAGAHQVLTLLNQWSISPDIITFGVLAVGCKNHQKATVFVNEMRKLGYSPNTEIIGALLNNACRIADFRYMQDTLLLMEELGIEPNEKMIKYIEDVLETARKNIIDMEHGKSVPDIYRKVGFTKNYKEFCKVYEEWLKNMKFETSEHVWNQFKTDIFEKTAKPPSNVQVLE